MPHATGMSTLFGNLEGISHQLDPLTARDMRLRETCYGAIYRPGRSKPVFVVNIISIMIIQKITSNLLVKSYLILSKFIRNFYQTNFVSPIPYFSHPHYL